MEPRFLKWKEIGYTHCLTHNLINYVACTYIRNPCCSFFSEITIPGGQVHEILQQPQCTCGLTESARSLLHLVNYIPSYTVLTGFIITKPDQLTFRVLYSMIYFSLLSLKTLKLITKWLLIQQF